MLVLVAAGVIAHSQRRALRSAGQQDANSKRDCDLDHHIELADHLPRLDLAGLIRVKIPSSAPEAIRPSNFVFDASECATVSF